MNKGIEKDSHFTTHLHQTSSKSSMKSRLRILETLKIPSFLETEEHNIDVFSMLPISCRSPAFNSELIKERDLLVLKMGC